MFGEKWEEARDTHLCIFHTCSLHVLLLLLSGFASEEGAEFLVGGPCHPHVPARGLSGSSSFKARGLNGMFSEGSVCPESHASEIRAKKGSGAMTI